jgi:small-conductance mechanosensitive channel
VGDVVELEGDVGIVKEIGFRTTKIENRDNIILIIPNSKFIGENVINWSHIEQKTRFSVDVGVAYGSDVELVKKVLLECARDHQEVTEYPKPFVRFDDFGNSSLDFQLFFWTDNAFRVENIKSDLRFAIDKKFRENKITIPFPQRDVHIKKP